MRRHPSIYRKWLAPQNLTATAVSPTSITLAWTNTRPDLYVEIWRNGVFLDYRTPGLATYLDSGLAGSTTYSYRLNHAPAGAADRTLLSVAAAATTPASGLVAPTGLLVTILTDSSLRLDWTNGDGTANTEVYVNGGLNQTVGAGVAAVLYTGLTRATSYTFTLRHSKSGLFSPFTADAVGRPAVSASGGNVTESGGYRYHYAGGSDFTLTINVGGRLSYRGVGRGGYGGGPFPDIESFSAGGGGGSGGGFFAADDTLEPAGSFPVQCGTTANNGYTAYRSELGAPGGNGEQGQEGRGGNGASSPQGYVGGAGWAAGAGEANGGGGGAGAGGAGGRATADGSGGPGGAPVGGIPLFNNFGRGGPGGRHGGTNAYEWGMGGPGLNPGNPVLSSAPYAGAIVLWYPI